MTEKTLAVKILESRPDLPIILCSGYSDDINPDAIKETGIRQFLMKPVGMHDLVMAVSLYLSHIFSRQTFVAGTQ